MTEQHEHIGKVVGDELQHWVMSDGLDNPVQLLLLTLEREGGTPEERFLQLRAGKISDEEIADRAARELVALEAAADDVEGITGLAPVRLKAALALSTILTPAETQQILGRDWLHQVVRNSFRD